MVRQLRGPSVQDVLEDLEAQRSLHDDLLRSIEIVTLPMSVSIGNVKPFAGQNENCCWHTIDLQKMNWKFRAGFHELTGVSPKRHCGHNCTGGYTREHQDTGQFCDYQSLIQPV